MQFAQLHIFFRKIVGSVKNIDYLCRLRNNKKLWTIQRFIENSFIKIEAH